jgi:hypothetical protein
MWFHQANLVYPNQENIPTRTESNTTPTRQKIQIFRPNKKLNSEPGTENANPWRIRGDGSARREEEKEGGGGFDQQH